MGKHELLSITQANHKVAKFKRNCRNRTDSLLAKCKVVTDDVSKTSYPGLQPGGQIGVTTSHIHLHCGHND